MNSLIEQLSKVHGTYPAVEPHIFTCARLANPSVPCDCSIGYNIANPSDFDESRIEFGYWYPSRQAWHCGSADGGFRVNYLGTSITEALLTELSYGGELPKEEFDRLVAFHGPARSDAIDFLTTMLSPTGSVNVDRVMETWAQLKSQL